LKYIDAAPLKIQASKIAEAGMGLFTKIDLQPQTLVGIYSGTVGTPKDTNENSKYVF